MTGHIPSDDLHCSFDALPIELQGSHGLTVSRCHKSLTHANFGGGGGGDNDIPETAEQQQLAAIAMEKLRYYDEKLAPLEDAYIEKTHTLNTDAARKYASGAAASSTQAAFDPVKKKVAQSEFQSGTNPNSAKFRRSLADIHQKSGSASGENQAMGEVAQTDEYVKGMSNVAAIGAGESTSAQAGFGGLASLSKTKAHADAASAWNERQSRLSTVGSAIGAGAGIAAAEMNKEQPQLSWSGASPDVKSEEEQLYSMFNKGR